ncbi:unnamed protein product [Penicillium bialowiezense]
MYSYAGPQRGFPRVVSWWNSEMLFNPTEARAIKVQASYFNKGVMSYVYIPLANVEDPFERGPETGIGDLDGLPAELLMDIVGHLDMSSIFHLRDVNVAARDLVLSSRDYRAVQQEKELAAALRTSSLGKKVTLTMFAYMVWSKKCECCSEPGQLLAIQLWKRLCDSCASHAHPDIPLDALHPSTLYRLGQNRPADQTS